MTYFDAPALAPLLNASISHRALEIISDYHQMHTIRTLQRPYDVRVGRVFGRNAAPHYVAPSVLGAAWADTAETPLRADDAWNTGRHASLTGQNYKIDHNGLPINPYLHTGIAGQGVNGPLGPSHIVDLALFERDACGLLCLRAISKGDMRFLCGGYVDYTKDVADIEHPDRFVDALTCEMFEELISGSVPLIPAYQVYLKEFVEQYIKNRRERDDNYRPSDKDIARITREQETQLKLAQVKHYDPDFWKNLQTYCEKMTCTYRGPIYSSNRNTDNAWVETAMHWAIMDDKAWKHICGPRPKYPYAFAAGDDADDQGVYVINPTLLDSMPGSHAAMVMYAFAQYLAQSNTPASGWMISQFQENLSYMHHACLKNTAHPEWTKLIRA